MSLPQAVIDYLDNSAVTNGSNKVEPNEDLFVAGILDSFALVDFITILEEHCSIRIPDAEVVPANFRTIEAIGRYVASRKN
jgi:acyl carrier protein